MITMPIDPQLLSAALQSAAQIEGPGSSQTDLLITTWSLYEAITNPTTAMTVEVTISRDGKTRAFWKFSAVTTKEILMTAMTMDDTADIVVSTTDDHGDPTADALSWAASGPDVAITPSADTKSCHVVPLAEGTGITVTASDPSAPNAPAFVATFDIGPGPTSQLTGVVTVNTGANVPAPPAPPAPPVGP